LYHQYAAQGSAEDLSGAIPLYELDRADGEGYL
jgi:hypothetical protein